MNDDILGELSTLVNIMRWAGDFFNAYLPERDKEKDREYALAMVPDRITVNNAPMLQMHLHQQLERMRDGWTPERMIEEPTWGQLAAYFMDGSVMKNAPKEARQWFAYVTAAIMRVWAEHYYTPLPTIMREMSIQEANEILGADGTVAAIEKASEFIVELRSQYMQSPIAFTVQVGDLGEPTFYDAA